MSKYRFRINRGQHQQSGKTYASKAVQNTMDPARLDNCAGDIIESDIDLRNHNHPDLSIQPQKFTLLNGNDVEAKPTIDDVPAMNVPQLKAFAEQEGIDVTGITKKAEFVEIIQAALVE